MLSRQIKEPLLYDIKTNKRTRRKKFFCLLLPKQTTLSVFSLKSFNFTFLKWLIRILITCLSEITVQEYGDFLNWSFLGVFNVLFISSPTFVFFFFTRYTCCSCLVPWALETESLVEKVPNKTFLFIKSFLPLKKLLFVFQQIFSLLPPFHKLLLSQG